MLQLCIPFIQEELATAMEVNVSSTEEKISPTSAIMGSEKLEFTDFYEGEFGKVKITCRCDVPRQMSVSVSLLYHL